MEVEKTAKNQNKEIWIFVKFDSIDSIIRSIRSIMCRWAMVDRSDIATSRYWLEKKSQILA